MRLANDPDYDKKVSARYRENNREAIRARQLAWAEKNRERNRQVASEWYYNNLDRVFNTGLMFRHGITAAEFEERLAMQDSACAICKSTDTKKKGARLAIDHDHTCCPRDRSCFKCRRGLLCAHCNVGLGHFGDSIEMLETAIQYLKDHRASGPLQETEERPGW